MLIIVKDGKLTEKRKLEAYKYVRYFKVMNRISKMLEEIEKLEDYMEETDKISIRNNVEDFERELDSIEKRLKRARKKFEDDKAIWQTGDIKDLYLSNIRERRKKNK